MQRNKTGTNKDIRRPYRGAKAFCRSCRNHGGCPYCEAGRLHARRRDEQATDNAILEYLQASTTHNKRQA